MKSQTPGKSTSEIEVLSINPHGLWLFTNSKEYFLPFEEFPWFKKSKVSDVMNVELLHGFHLRWPSLDIDLALDSLENLAGYPLIYS